VAVMTRSWALPVQVGCGVNASGWSRSYFKRASALSKRTVGGPNRSEGLPYRGPSGLVTAALTAVALLMVSDGEVSPPRVREDSRRPACQSVRTRRG
jgi:hypothetical protein